MPSLSLIAASALAMGCSDKPQGGGQTGHDGTTCDETVTVLASPEASSPLGFRAADVLAYAQGSFQSPIHWLPAGELASYGPEQGEGQITVDVAYTGGEIRFVESKTKNEGGEELDIATVGGCRNRLEIDVEMTLTSEGGALSEVVRTALGAEDARWARAGASIDADDVGGAFSATAKPGFVAAGIVVEAGFSTAGTSWGSVSGRFEMESGDAMGQGFATYARWPSAAECGGDVVLPVDATLFSFDAVDATSLGSSAGPASLTWTGGASTSLTTSLEIASDVVCAMLGADEEALVFDAHWIAASDDGRIDSRLPVSVEAISSGGALEMLSIYSNGPYLVEGVSPDDFAATYGVSGFDLGAYDQGSVQLTATVVPGGNGASTAGRIEILGLTVPPCVSNPPPPEENGGGACEGIQSVVVGSAEWQ